MTMNETTGEMCLGIIRYAFEHDNPGLNFERNQSMYLANDTNAAYMLYLEKYIVNSIDINFDEETKGDE